MTTLAKPRELSDRTRRGRAINSIAEFLRSSLAVPNIYIEPHIQGHLDLLAVDRGGAGDLHGVEIRTDATSSPLSAALRSHVINERSRLVHYRYIALPKSESLLRQLPNLDLFSPDGIGRVGILLISEHTNAPPAIEVAIKPERYRVPAASMERVDRFLEKNRPDIEVRI